MHAFLRSFYFVCCYGSALLFTAPSWAQDAIRYFRIGAGTASGLYFPMGALIANAISNPPGSRPCDRGGSCGVPGLIATAQTTSGFAENIRAVQSKALQGAISRADFVQWAYTGTGPFKQSGAQTDIRAIAGLYQEKILIVTLKDGPARKVEDLRNRRVALGEKNNSDLPLIRLVLQAHNLNEKKIKPFYAPLPQAFEALRQREVDSVIFIAPDPSTELNILAASAPVTVLPIKGDVADKLRQQNPFLSVALIDSGTYRNVPATATLGLSALLIVNAQQPDDLVAGITRALWHPSTEELFIRGDVPIRLMSMVESLESLPIPLHPGALAYYREVMTLIAPGTPATP